MVHRKRSTTMTNNGDDHLCWKCVTDSVLRERIRSKGRGRSCTFCGKRRKALSIQVVADLIDAALRRYYRPSEPTGHAVPDSDNIKYWEEGETAVWIIQEIAEVEPEIAEAIDSELSARDWRAVKDGDDSYYGGRLLEHVDPYPGELVAMWQEFEERVKHKVRFFDAEGKQLLDELIGDLPTLADGRAIVTIEPGNVLLFRARIAESRDDIRKFIRYPARELGPPPAHLALNARMNPPGVAVFYGAFSEKVAIAEKRPPVGAFVAIGTFSLLRSIKLLDLTVLKFTYHQESVFSPKYDDLRNKVAFFERLHSIISRPVLPDDELLEYLPTQAVAAYVANVMGLDGVIYTSTQTGVDSDGIEQPDRSCCNIVLLGEAARVARDNSARDGTEKMAEDVPAAQSENGVQVDDTVVDVLDFWHGADNSCEDATDGGHEATLRVEAQPKVVKVCSVDVGTIPIFAHLYEDGDVIVDYDDGESDDFS